MALSARATAFLKTQERRNSIRDERRILEALDRAQLPIFEPVIDFQQQYGGCTFYAIYEPMVYGILHPKPRSVEANNISGFSDDDGITYLFECVDTLYQMSFHIDGDGTYYENFRAVAPSMDKHVEDLALRNELDMQQVKWHKAKSSTCLSIDGATARKFS